MLLPIRRLKPAITKTLYYTRQGVSYVIHHRRIFLIIFFIAPFISYLLAWMLSTTEAFFPRPLREAKEVLIIVAHPDDECIFL
jgi:hypothetical protein